MRLRHDFFAPCLMSWLAYGGLCGSAAVGQQTQDLDSELEAVVVTARKVELSVLAAEQIDSRAPVNLQSLLEDLPGVSYSRSGGLGGQIVVRGFNSNTPRTLLLVDGERFRGRNTLEFNLIDPNQVERIEVLRGPASAFYGPDAMVGVVNVVTRRAEGDVNGEFQFKPVLRAVDYHSANNLFGARLEGQWTGHGLDGLLGLSYRKAQELQSPDGEIPNSDFEFKQLDLRTGYALAAGQRLELTAKLVDAVSGRAGGIGGVPGAPLVVQREEPLRERYAKLAYQGSLDDWGVEQLQASVYARKLYSNLTTENRTTANRLVESVNIVDGPVVLGGKVFGVRPWSQGSFTAGVDFFNESRQGSQSGSTTTNYNSAGAVTSMTTTAVAQNTPDSAQLDAGVFVRADWNLAPQWQLAVASRLDYVRSTTDAGPVIAPALQVAYERNRKNIERPWTGEVGISFNPWQPLALVANVGKSFRVPSTVESFGSSRQGTGYNVPNPDLKPERGVTYEVGARWQQEGVSANVTVFHSNYDEFIVRQSVTFLGLASFQNQNTGKARVQGVELDGQWVQAFWKLFFDASWLRGTDLNTQRPLSYIPPLNGRLGVRFTLPQSSYVEAVAPWSTDKKRIDTTAERPTDGYVTLNLYAGYDLQRWFKYVPMTVRVGVENVFDRSYRLPTTVENISYARSLTNPLLEPARAVSVSLKSNF